MSSPIAGNESFTNVENLVGSLNFVDVASLTANTVVAENATIDTQSLLSDLKPTLEGLAVVSVTGDNAYTYAANTITVNDYDGTTETTVTLPAATAGTVVVHAQGVDTNGGGGNTLTFTCAGSDVFFTGSNIRTTTNGFATSVADNTQLEYDPADGATTNLLTVGCKIYFWCVSDGIWHIAADLSTNPTATTGEFAFATPP